MMIKMPLLLQVRIYDLTDGNGFRCLHQLDVGKVIVKEKETKRGKQTEIGKGEVLNLNGLLMTRQIDNTSPGGCARREICPCTLIRWSSRKKVIMKTCQFKILRRFSAVKIEKFQGFS